jgi:hypothetical protein
MSPSWSCIGAARLEAQTVTWCEMDAYDMQLFLLATMSAIAVDLLSPLLSPPGNVAAKPLSGATTRPPTGEKVTPQGSRGSNSWARAFESPSWMF